MSGEDASFKVVRRCDVDDLRGRISCIMSLWTCEAACTVCGYSGLGIGVITHDREEIEMCLNCMKGVEYQIVGESE